VNQPSKNLRTRGVKPDNPDDRARRVAEAVKELEDIGAAFSVADVAERAGISRATIYRSQKLRTLVGARGDGVRSVDAEIHARVCERHNSLKSKARELRQRLADAEKGWDEMRDRALAAEHQLRVAQQRIQALSKRVAVSNSAHATVPLAHIAEQIGADGMKRARRQLALVLHPDLFSQDPDVAAIAGELLRAVNEVVD
jgi:DNA-binding MurR/RpiR family transcriptional regulator